MQNQEKDRIFLKQCYANSGANLCWALGVIICNFTPILPYFQHWGDEPRPRLFSREQIEWRPKKKVFTRNGPRFFPDFRWRPKKGVFIRNETLFSPNSSTDLRSDAHQSQIIEEDADEDHTQIIGGIQSNYWGDISPHPARVSAPLYAKLT